MSGDYELRRRDQNAAYSKAYAEWVESLSPKKRRELEAQGLHAPKVDSYHTGKRLDVSDIPLAAKEDGAQESGDIHGEQGCEPTWAALRFLIADLLADPNPALGIDCLALVSGVGFMGESMSSIAKRHCVTRAAVSKRCVQLTQELRMMPARSMRSLTARNAYRTTQKTIRQDHERFNSK